MTNLITSQLTPAWVCRVVYQEKNLESRFERPRSLICSAFKVKTVCLMTRIQHPRATSHVIHISVEPFAMVQGYNRNNRTPFYSLYELRHVQTWERPKTVQLRIPKDPAAVTSLGVHIIWLQMDNEPGFQQKGIQAPVPRENYGHSLELAFPLSNREE